MKRSLIFAVAASAAGTALFQARAQRVAPIPIEPTIDRPTPRIWPRPPRPIPIPPQREIELQLDSQSAKVEIRGGVARTKLTQTFVNTSGRTVEGYYLFPLPSGAAIGNFAMTLNGKRLEAEVLDGDRAREIYNGIVAKWRDPAILEFVDRDVVRARLFPIGANDKPVVELSYDETLRAQGESFRYVLPQKLAVGGAAKKSDVEIRIFDAASGNSKGARTIYSPTHEVEIRRDEKGAHISGEWKDASAGRDLTLLFSPSGGKVALSVVTHREAGEDGYFLVLAAPDAASQAREIAAKDIVFVCDTSGSMQGEKIEQARRALQTLLGTLGPNDRFGLETFATDVNLFRDNLVPASKSNIDAARAWTNEIKALGGTNINDALISAIKMFEKTGRPQQIVFLTDGLPTVGERDVAQIMKNVAGARSTVENARLFTFGVGYDVNTKLLDGLAEENKGASDYVAPEQDIETVVGALGQKIASPVLTGLKLDFGDVRVRDIHPKALPDLFRGGQIAIFGRFTQPSVINGSGVFPISLRGVREGKTETIAGGFNVLENVSNEAIARLWAMRKVGYLLDDARRAGRPIEGDARDEIIKLSKKWGIVTPITAGLITEDGEIVMPATRDFDARNGAMNAPVTASPKTRAAADSAFRSSSGEAAVATSKAVGQMRRAETVRDDASLALRVVAGKSFTLRGEVWTDWSFDLKTSPKPKQIKFASPGYFALLKDARVAKWLALGERVLWTNGGASFEIVP